MYLKLSYIMDKIGQEILIKYNLHSIENESNDSN